MMLIELYFVLKVEKLYINSLLCILLRLFPSLRTDFIAVPLSPSRGFFFRAPTTGSFLVVLERRAEKSTKKRAEGSRKSITSREGTGCCEFRACRAENRRSHAKTGDWAPDAISHASIRDINEITRTLIIGISNGRASSPNGRGAGYWLTEREILQEATDIAGAK